MFWSRQLGNDLAGLHAISLQHLDRREQAADLGRDTHLGRAHDADNRRRRLGARQPVCADAGRDHDQAERDNAY
jgi:hypothetical protein